MADKSQYKPEYAYMLDKLYPVIRAVDFRFSLSRRGMKQDTIYTNEPDTTYARAVEYLENVNMHMPWKYFVRMMM